jgi:hypothetical protein
MRLHNTWRDVHHAHIVENCPYKFHSIWLDKYVSPLIKQNKLTISLNYLYMMNSFLTLFGRVWQMGA